MVTVELLGKFYDNHSLSIINRNIALQLANDEDISLFITPLDNYDSQYHVDKKEVKILKGLCRDVGEPDVQIRLTYPPIWRYPVSDKTKIIYVQPWEYPRVPSEWQYKWETFADGVISISQWTSDKFLDGGINPSELFTIPCGYKPDVFNPAPEPSKFFDAKKFTFVFVGNAQKRKGLDVLLNTWKDTFVRADNVQLFIKDNVNVYGQSNVLPQILAMQYRTDCAKIIYNDDMISDQDMANIYKNAKVLVHPFRGEGFGMHIQEAVACGVLPIYTRGGPPDEFIPEEVGFKINSTKTIVDMTNPELFAVKPGDSLTLMGGHSWILEPDADNMKFHMKLIYAHHERNKFFNVVKEYQNPNTWENVAKQYKNAIMVTHGKSDTPKRRI
jgi:glycosyltransferase involved in cell wall biosynthesis